jgi:negative regulator of sigma E activity
LAQAQAAVAQAQSLADEAADAVTLVEIESQTRARAVESIEARSRISLELRRLEIQAARNLDHAILDDEEAEEGGLVHGLGSNGVGQGVTCRAGAQP